MTRTDNLLKADAGKTLLCNFNDINYGSEVSLGYLWFDKDNNRLDKPYLLTIADFVEVEDPILGEYVEEVKSKLNDNPTYADAKKEAVKLKYSNDDQIALMLNYAEDADGYKTAYDEMQRWRETAAAIAKAITESEV